MAWLGSTIIKTCWQRWENKFPLWSDDRPELSLTSSFYSGSALSLWVSPRKAVHLKSENTSNIHVKRNMRNKDRNPQRVKYLHGRWCHLSFLLQTSKTEITDKETGFGCIIKKYSFLHLIRMFIDFFIQLRQANFNFYIYWMHEVWLINWFFCINA